LICQECKKRPATFHFTKVLNGEKKEMHICEQCAKESSESYAIDGNGGFSIHNLLSGLLNFDSALSSPNQVFNQSDSLHCKKCNMTMQEFRKTGRFGCAECYKTFHSYITPILRKVHGGNTVHKGKIPKRIGGNLHLRRELETLKKDLLDAIQQEEFEKAATIRDRIRLLEQELSEKREGE
jgi:protein arginine kinase activator